jgi:hypothetical protein
MSDNEDQACFNPWEEWEKMEAREIADYAHAIELDGKDVEFYKAGRKLWRIIMRKENFRRKTPPLWLILFAALPLCAACVYKHQPPRTISISEVWISGIWKNHVDVVPGDYTLEDSGSSTTHASVTLRLRLAQTFAGKMENPAGTFRLVPLTASGSPLESGSLELRIITEEKFNEFVRGKVGDTALISFESLYGLSRKDDFASIAGFDGKTVDPPTPSSVASDTASGNTASSTPAAASGTRNTDTDPIFNPRTEARTGRRIVAVPELTATKEIGEDLSIGITSAVTTGLTANKNINRVIDYNQINRIMKQHGFEASDMSNPAKYAEIGKALNVDTITVGTISLGGKILFVQSYTVSVQLIDISTMAIVGAFTCTYPPSGFIDSMTSSNIIDLAADYAKKMKVSQ